jgi:putative ABC transport system substrate-binding protein
VEQALKLRRIVPLAARCVFVGFLLFACAAGAQQANRLYRIGVLNEAWAANHPAVEGLKEGLRELGLLEGRDVAFEIRFTKGDPVATAAAAEELAKAGVDLIFTSNEPATLAAKKATQKIPIVFTLVGDPVGSTVVPSLSRPGGNITGVSSRAIELAPKRLEMLKVLAPEARRVWFIYHVTDVTAFGAVDNIRIAAGKLKVELISKSVANAQELNAVLKQLEPGDGALAPAVDTLDIPVGILEAAKVPSVFPTALWVEHGALVSYGPDFRAQGMQSARLIAKILRGARPQDLPVEGADRIDLALNLSTARKLGLAIPPKILFRANVAHQ